MFLSKKILKAFAFLSMLFSLSAFALDDAVNTGRFNDKAIDDYDTVAYTNFIKLLPTCAG